MAYDPEESVYQAADHKYSINDLLRSALDPEYMANGLPRISDFHLKVGEAVRFRLDDDLHEVPGGEALTQDVMEQLVYPLLRESQVERMQGSRMVDIDAGYELKDSDYSFRINAFRDRDGLAATIRLLPREVPFVGDLGIPNDIIWKTMVHSLSGLVLVTGITGSGKSTTIASLIREISKSRPVRIITLEDPVEYIFTSEKSLISQREVGAQIENFSQGLRSALRENPDIIYVGEIRDHETASLALKAAETGHMVFSTMHTIDAVGAVRRIVDLFPGEREKEVATQLSFSLGFVINQKLVPRIDGSGRLAAMEVLRNIGGAPNLIRTSKLSQLYSVMETKSSEGMNTMEQRLLDLYEDELISREDAILYANREDIASRL